MLQDHISVNFGSRLSGGNSSVALCPCKKLLLKI